MTSSGINHNVDELLVGVVTQLKLRRERQEEKTNKDKVWIQAFKLQTYFVIFIHDFLVSGFLWQSFESSSGQEQIL